MKFDLPTGLQRPFFESLHYPESSPEAFFKKKQLRTLTIFFTAAALYVASAIMTDFTAWNALTGIPRGLYWLVRNFLPSAQSLSVLRLIFKTSLHTAVIAVTASTAAFCVACLAAIAGSQTTGRFRILRIACAGLASFFRNIPLPAWSILLLLSFKQNAVTGFLALFFFFF